MAAVLQCINTTHNRVIFLTIQSEKSVTRCVIFFVNNWYCSARIHHKNMNEAISSIHPIYKHRHTHRLQSVLYIYPDSLLPTYLFANEPTCWTSCIRRGWEKGGEKERERRKARFCRFAAHGAYPWVRQLHSDGVCVFFYKWLNKFLLRNVFPRNKYLHHEQKQHSENMFVPLNGKPSKFHG